MEDLRTGWKRTFQPVFHLLYQKGGMHPRTHNLCGCCIVWSLASIDLLCWYPHCNMKCWRP
ncbi:hypothetical protein OIU79_022594 [Salix purpurea]|uniref:Uncharacterized protein n=1 Tax=Salix purpurea TaxID=77065 RepID=A0A9Q0WJ94_SALPP|nr:hypothetical protein OIU79_022594 [Salix purpurea]